MRGRYLALVVLLAVVAAAPFANAGPSSKDVTKVTGPLTQEPLKPSQMPPLGTTASPALPLTLTIDPPSLQSTSGQSVLHVEACVRDANNAPVLIMGAAGVTGSGMQFTLDSSPTAYPMTPVLEKTNAGSPLVGKPVVTGCNTATLTVPQCQLAGAHLITVTVALPNIALKASTQATFDKLQPVLAVTNMLASAALGTPVKVTGAFTGACAPVDISLSSSAVGQPVAATVNGTVWTATLNFDKAVFAGKVSGTVSLAGSALHNPATASFSVQLTPPALIANVLNLPHYMNVGWPTDVTVQVTSGSSGAAVAGVTLNVAVGDWPSCGAKTTDASGLVVCKIVPPADLDPSKIGVSVPVKVTLAGLNAATLTLAGSPMTTPLTKEGWQIHVYPASFIDPTIQAGRAGGVLLNNYVSGQSNQDASHCNKCSWQFFSPQLNAGPAKAFDTAYIHINNFPYYVYVNTILIRTGEVQFKAPSNLVVPLALDGFNGSPPAIVAKCWSNAACFATPTFSNLTLSDSDVELELVAAKGQIALQVASLSIHMDFECGGLAVAICGTLKDSVNSNAQATLSTLLTGQLARTVAPLNAFIGWSFASIADVEITPAGDLIVKGPPAPD